MWGYYGIIALLGILTVSDSSLNLKKYRQAIALYFILLLGFYAGFRGGDADYANYAWAYAEAGKGYAELSDWGFNVLLILLNYISADPVMMFVVVALLSVSLNIRSFYRYTPYLSACILLYFVHNFALKDMIQIRAGLASAICLFSARYLPSGQYKKALLLWVLAMTMQMSSIVYGLAYLVHRVKPSRRLLLSALIVSMIVGTVYPFGQIIKSIADIGEYSERTAAYVMYGDTEYASVIGIWSNINTVKALIISFGLLFFYERLSDRFIYFKPLFGAYIAGLCWLMCFNDFAIVGARMSNILMCGEPVLLTFPYVLLSKQSRVIYSIALILLALAVFNFNIGPTKITPYYFCFS